MEEPGIPIYTIGYNADIDALEEISLINEGASINADTEDVVYKLAICSMPNCKSRRN